MRIKQIEEVRETPSGKAFVVKLWTGTVEVWNWYEHPKTQRQRKRNARIKPILDKLQREQMEAVEG